MWTVIPSRKLASTVNAVWPQVYLPFCLSFAAYLIRAGLQVDRFYAETVSQTSLLCSCIYSCSLFTSQVRVPFILESKSIHLATQQADKLLQSSNSAHVVFMKLQQRRLEMINVCRERHSGSTSETQIFLTACICFYDWIECQSIPIRVEQV